MDDAAHVPELRDDAAAGFMHRAGHRLPPFDLRVGPQAGRRRPAETFLRDAGGFGNDQPRRGALRSEEHTSELQSLMRISYAVFCLKKKTASLKNASQRMTNS